MKPGAVIIDMAASRGGNCELSVAGMTADIKGVRIFGPRNPAGDLPGNASSLYARNLYAFLETMFDKKNKALNINWDDELVKGTLVTRDGQIVHPRLQAAKAA
jgi:H+-translocating NAD(P) transhydrogenase subunit alpha